jgi:ferritin
MSRKSSLLDLLRKVAVDGNVDIENEAPESVEAAPAETPTEGTASPDLPTEDTEATEETKFVTDEIEQMLCQQIGNEMFAFYEYTAAGAWFKGQGFDGFAAWATKQTCDEKIHMQKILDFLVELGCTPDLPQITGVAARFGSIKEAVEGIFKREKAVTKNWRIIAKAAIAENDAGTLDLAQWFVREQMEEEDVVKAVLARLEAAGDGAGLLVLDHMLTEEYGE